MAKSKILKELANDEITIDKALKRLMLLANDLDDEELLTWVEKELAGYSVDDELPDYRIIKSNNFIYSGIIGGRIQMTKQPLMPHLLGKDLDAFISCSVREPIATIIDKGKNGVDPGATLGRDLTSLAGEVFKNSGGGWDGIQCTSITQHFTMGHFAGIGEKLKHKLLKVFMKLDKEYGNLDDLDIDTSKISQEKIDQTKQELQQIIYNITINNTDNSKTKIKSKKVIKDTNVGSGTQNISKTASLAPTFKIDAPK